MILIDAHNIAAGGGLTLLNYLENNLSQNNKNYCIIKRHANLSNPSVLEIECRSPRFRRRILREAVNKFKPQTILCFGNYPPEDKFSIKTITYLHNPYLVSKWHTVILKDKLIPLRQFYLRKSIRNTDYFIFQNNLIKEKFVKLYGYDRNINYLILPFFDEERISRFLIDHQSKKDQFIYVSLPYPHKNHHYLLKVWAALQASGHNPTLILTVPERENEQLVNRINNINKKGGKIINLGILPFDQILHHTAESKYCIFPSLFETLGLGLIEAALLKTKVIAAGLPYTDEVIKASLYFDPEIIDSGVDAVLYALNNENALNETKPIIQNRIKEFLELL